MATTKQIRDLARQVVRTGGVAVTPGPLSSDEMVVVHREVDRLQETAAVFARASGRSRAEAEELICKASEDTDREVPHLDDPQACGRCGARMGTRPGEVPKLHQVFGPMGLKVRCDGCQRADRASLFELVAEQASVLPWPLQPGDRVVSRSEGGPTGALRHYFVDGREVTREQYEARARDWRKPGVAIAAGQVWRSKLDGELYEVKSARPDVHPEAWEMHCRDTSKRLIVAADWFESGATMVRDATPVQCTVRALPAPPKRASEHAVRGVLLAAGIDPERVRCAQEYPDGPGAVERAAWVVTVRGALPAALTAEVTAMGWRVDVEAVEHEARAAAHATAAVKAARGWR